MAMEESACGRRNRLKLRKNQWRSKAVRGPGSTVTWGPSLSLPPLPLPPLSLPLSLLFPSPDPPPAAKRPTKSSQGVWGAL